MTRLLASAALLAVVAVMPMLAQTTSPPASSMNQGPASNNTGSNGQSSPDTQTMPSQQATPLGIGADRATQPASTTADLTGQTIYSSKGKKIGTVSGMTTDSKGQQAATVMMGKYLGMGGQSVAIPVGSLQARAAGGYTTNLTAAELKTLSGTDAMHAQ